ncbi:DUF2577 domain-containing protein [Robertmurraya massiliosenegalensis]|uniref:DUF2577 domain-containing protein n=1 Tax=Robertmurraya TaxID=2837507 RepID=UPI0039A4873C
MASLNESIKKIALNALDASMPVQIMFGTVTRASPLRVNVEQRLNLETAHLVITQQASEFMTVGTKVVLLRQQGGQKYVVLDKVVSR